MTDYTKTKQVRSMHISTKGQIATAQATGRPMEYTDWQWVIDKNADGSGWGALVAYNNGSGWVYLGGRVQFESVAEFNEHVDNFAANAVKGGHKVHEEGWL